MGTRACILGPSWVICGHLRSAQVTWHHKGHHNAQPVPIGSRLGSAYSALCQTEKEGSLFLVTPVILGLGGLILFGGFLSLGGVESLILIKYKISVA